MNFQEQNQLSLSHAYVMACYLGELVENSNTQRLPVQKKLLSLFSLKFSAESLKNATQTSFCVFKEMTNNHVQYTFIVYFKIKTQNYVVSVIPKGSWNRETAQEYLYK